VHSALCKSVPSSLDALVARVPHVRNQMSVLNCNSCRLHVSKLQQLHCSNCYPETLLPFNEAWRNGAANSASTTRYIDRMLKGARRTCPHFFAVHNLKRNPKWLTTSQETGFCLTKVDSVEEELDVELPAGGEVAVVGPGVEEELEAVAGGEVALVGAVAELEAKLPAGGEVALVGAVAELEAELPAGGEVALVGTVAELLCLLLLCL